MEDYRTLNPATEELLERFPIASAQSVEAALVASAAAAHLWAAEPVAARAALFVALAEKLESNEESFARLITTEMGKPLGQSRAEVQKCATGCRYFAEHVPQQIAPEERQAGEGRSVVRFDPLGSLLAIMPWNFPFWQLFRFAGPAMIAGNTVILKHAPSTPGCAVALDGLFRDCGAPSGVFQALFVSNETAGRIIADERIRGVTLTGSPRAGRAVAEAAGHALKKAVLELGGSDPFIVLDDADIDAAAREGAAARCMNNGQTCIAAKRFLVDRRVMPRFRAQFVEAMRSRQLGDPCDSRTENGPMAREDLRTGLARQVERAVAAGGKLLTGGTAPPRTGYYYEPTVIEGLDPSAAVAREEMFGPVALLYTFASEQELVRLANGTPYGLGASIWTSDPSRGEALAPKIDAGNVFVNEQVKSDPRLPFGGVKDSGFGRELSIEGAREFVNVKTVRSPR